jgi:hypothetical protein
MQGSTGRAGIICTGLSPPSTNISIGVDLKGKVPGSVSYSKIWEFFAAVPPSPMLPSAALASDVMIDVGRFTSRTIIFIHSINWYSNNIHVFKLSLDVMYSSTQGHVL